MSNWNEHTGYNYEALNKMVRKHKSALTRAKNSGDPRKVIAAVDKAFAEFDLPGNIYPDAWATWQVAKDDALWKLRREAIEAGDYQ